MKKLSVLIVFAVMAFMFLSPAPLPGTANAANHGAYNNIPFDPGECPDGKMVINISHGVQNNADSGVGRYWAYDNYQKIIRVWQTGPNEFCVVVKNRGTFRSTPGQSPAGTDIIAGDVVGSMNGGYRATITGTLNPNPAHRRNGNIGNFDYGWSGDPNSPAPSPFLWVDEYFEPGYTFDYFWWGWVYKTKDSVWVNSAGNAGDITD